MSETVTSDDEEVGGTPHRAKMRGRGIVQALEWEVLPKDQAYRVGLGNRVLSGELQNARELAVLRCVDDRGKKITVIGAASHVRRLLGNGLTSARNEVNLHEELFPVVINGWLSLDGQGFPVMTPPPSLINVYAGELRRGDILSKGEVVVKFHVRIQTVKVTVARPGREYERSLIYDPQTEGHPHTEPKYELSSRVLRNSDVVRVLRRL